MYRHDIIYPGRHLIQLEAVVYMYAFNTQWDWLKHNNVMILHYLFTFKSGSYYRTGQFNLTISNFFVRNINGSAHNSWQDRWRSSWDCSESKTYRGTQCIYWKPFLLICVWNLKLLSRMINFPWWWFRKVP